MNDWKQVGEVALEVVTRALMLAAANTDDEAAAKEIRETVLEMRTQRTAA